MLVGLVSFFGSNKPWYASFHAQVCVTTASGDSFARLVSCCCQCLLDYFTAHLLGSNYDTNLQYKILVTTMAVFSLFYSLCLYTTVAARAGRPYYFAYAHCVKLSNSANPAARVRCARVCRPCTNHPPPYAEPAAGLLCICTELDIVLASV